MLKTITALLTILCLGPPSLPPVPPKKEAFSPPPEACGRPGLPSWAAEAAVADPEGAGTGLLVVRRPEPRRFAPLPRNWLELLVHHEAQRHGVDERLVRAVLKLESGGDPRAVSPKGALGLMQLMPETAALMGVQDPFDPEDNVAGGVKYLKLCLRRFGEDVILALAAYNAGPGAVAKYGGVPPYRETEEYVGRVLTAYRGPGALPLNLRAKAQAPPPIEEKSAPSPPGLNWRVPAPTWKIAPPQARVAAPRWKVPPPAPEPGGRIRGAQAGIAAPGPGSGSADLASPRKLRGI